MDDTGVDCQYPGDDFIDVSVTLVAIRSYESKFGRCTCYLELNECIQAIFGILEGFQTRQMRSILTLSNSCHCQGSFGKALPKDSTLCKG